MRRVKLLLSASVVMVLLAPAARVAVTAKAPVQGGAQPRPAARLGTIAERTSGMQKLDGLFPMYWDEQSGALFLEIPRLDAEFLYQTGIGVEAAVACVRTRAAGRATTSPVVATKRAARNSTCRRMRDSMSTP